MAQIGNIQENISLKSIYFASLMNSNNSERQGQSERHSISDSKSHHKHRETAQEAHHQKKEKKCYREYEKERKSSKKDKHKSKKHHKHRENEIDAKFSEDQEQPTSTPPLPNQNESPKKQIVQNELKKKMNFNDMAYYPKGTILSLKSCKIQIAMRKGKVDCGVEILSQQQHKILISQLIDPGFQIISIKRDKNQTQIIQYLSQPKKAYRFVVTWLEALKNQDNSILRDIAEEANQKKRIFGWHNDHIKLHIMSQRQFSMIGRFDALTKFGSKEAAACMKDERLVMIIQYPQRIYEIKGQYHPFSSISRKKEEFYAEKIEQLPTNDTEPEPIIDTIQDVPSVATQTQIVPVPQVPEEPQPVQRYWYEGLKVVYEGWDDVEEVQDNNQPHEEPVIDNTAAQAPLPPLPIVENPPRSDLPEYVEKIRLHFGIKCFEAILSDQEEEHEVKQKDLATELLESLEKRHSPSPHSAMEANYQSYSYYQQYPYYNYYDPSQYQPQQCYQPPMNNQWNYSTSNQAYQIQGYQPITHNMNYHSSAEQYGHQLNQNYRITQDQYYLSPQDPYSRPDQTYQGGYQY